MTGFITNLYPEFGHINPQLLPTKNPTNHREGSRASTSFIRNKERTNSSCTGTEPPTKPAKTDGFFGVEN